MQLPTGRIGNKNSARDSISSRLLLSFTRLCKFDRDSMVQLRSKSSIESFLGSFQVASHGAYDSTLCYYVILAKNSESSLRLE